MKPLDRKVTFGLIVGTRGFFNPQLARGARRQLSAKLDALGYSYVILPETATAHSAIETRADARKCAELFRTQGERIDGVIVALPNFGDELDLLGETLGRENCFGAIKGHVAPGPMTYFRLSTDDRRGRIKSYLGEGQFTDDPFGMDGGIAVCKVGHLRELLGCLCQNGFEHHVAMARTHCAEVLQEAVSKYLRWDLYRHR